MKLCIVLVLALSSFAFAVPQNAIDEVRVVDGADLKQPQFQERNVVANAIRDAIEGFRDLIINGNDNLPPLDPFVIDHVGPVEVSTTGVRITANIRNFNMEGLRWYHTDHVTFNVLRLALGVQITIPWITVTGNYDAHARVVLISHDAGGRFRFFINRLQTSIDIRVGTNILGGGTLILRELDIRIVIHDVTVQLDGLVGSSILNNMINNMIEGMVSNLLIDQMEDVSNMLSELLFDTVNEILSNFTLDDLLG